MNGSSEIYTTIIRVQNMSQSLTNRCWDTGLDIKCLMVENAEVNITQYLEAQRSYFNY